MSKYLDDVVLICAFSVLARNWDGHLVFLSPADDGPERLAPSWCSWLTILDYQLLLFRHGVEITHSGSEGH